MILSQFPTTNGIISLFICLKTISIRFTANNIYCDF